MEQVHAAVVHLDSQLHLTACCNSGITIGTECVLPLLQVESAWCCKLGLCCLMSVVLKH